MDKKAEAMKLALAVKTEQDELANFDTPENKERVVRQLSTRGVKVTERKIQSPLRFKVTLKNGTMDGVSLLDLERMRIKAGIPDE